MKTLNDYAIEVHKANQKWWLDLERHCLAHLGAEGFNEEMSWCVYG